jgi:uncharacterized OB-fold protein
MTDTHSGLRRGVFPVALDDPHADDATRPFWTAALEGRLVAPRCTACGTFVLPPQPFCFACRGRDFTWIDLPGTGTVYTFTVVRHPLHPGLAEVVPYAAGVVDLDGTQGAGARMITNITDCDVDSLAIGDPVEIWFDQVTPTYPVPRFRPF